MLDHKTWKEDPELLGQISIDSDFITKSGFFLEEFGRHMVKAYQIAHKTGKKSGSHWNMTRKTKSLSFL